MKIINSILVYVISTVCVYQARGDETGAVQYLQTAYPVYKMASFAANAVMISETYLKETRTIDSQVTADSTKLSEDDLAADIPQERQTYSDSMGQRFALKLNAQPETMFALAFQDVAFLQTEKGKHPLLVLGYRGCPFTVRKVEAFSAVQIREPVVIDIASTEGALLRPDPASTVPFIVTGYFTVPCFTAANVQWRFARPGMAFSTDKDTYKTTKAGATISFTAEGTKLDGFEKTEKTLK